MKNILYVFMLVCSLFIIACDSGGSGSNGPLSGGCTTEAAEGTWEMQSGTYQATNCGIEPVDCECYDAPDPTACTNAWNAGTGLEADCVGGEWEAAEDFNNYYEAFICSDDPDECDDLVVNSDGTFSMTEQGDDGGAPETGTWACTADGTEATMTYQGDDPEIITVYISGDSMTISDTYTEDGCSLSMSSTYLRTGDASGN